MYIYLLAINIYKYTYKSICLYKDIPISIIHILSYTMYAYHLCFCLEISKLTLESDVAKFSNWTAGQREYSICNYKYVCMYISSMCMCKYMSISSMCMYMLQPVFVEHEYAFMIRYVYRYRYVYVCVYV